MGIDRKNRGFTLLDLIIVLIILGILTMMIVPQLGSLANEAKLNGASWELVSAFQYAQSLAIEYQRTFSVKVFVKASRNQFSVKDYQYRSDTSAYPNNDPPLYTWGRVYNPIDKKPYIIDFDDPANLGSVISRRLEYENVSIDSVPGGGSDAEIVFYPDGHSSASDSIYVMSLGSLTNTITVDGISGKVTVD